MDLTPYDLILVNTSGGKDSAVAAWVVNEMAEAQGVKSKVRLVHATFPEEWEGTVEVVRKQADQLDLPLEVVSRGESLLDYVRRRQMWPSSKARYCTSDFKRAPIDKVITRLAPGLTRQMRVLNVMGIRAQESTARSKKLPFAVNTRRSNNRRLVHDWYPIFAMKVDEVWRIIRENAIPTHVAYSLGLPRLSCRFCIFAPREALILAGKYNRTLLQEYVDVEREIGHTFTEKLSIADVARAVDAGREVAQVRDWAM